ARPATGGYASACAGPAGRRYSRSPPRPTRSPRTPRPGAARSARSPLRDGGRVGGSTSTPPGRPAATRPGRPRSPPPRPRPGPRLTAPRSGWGRCRSAVVERSGRRSPTGTRGRRPPAAARSHREWRRHASRARRGTTAGTSCPTGRACAATGPRNPAPARSRGRSPTSSPHLPDECEGPLLLQVVEKVDDRLVDRGPAVDVSAVALRQGHRALALGQELSRKERHHRDRFATKLVDVEQKRAGATGVLNRLDRLLLSKDVKGQPERDPLRVHTG